MEKWARPPVRNIQLATLRGSHLSNTTCLTHVLFKSGEECSTGWCSWTRRKAHKKQARLY